MKMNNPGKSPVADINYLLDRISNNERNTISGIYLDESLQEFYSLKSELLIPAIPVGELDYTTGTAITENLISVIPEYLAGHSLLEKRKPSSEQHSLHFIKEIRGDLIDFVHVLRFDFKLTGGHGAISGKGDNQTFPAYSTDRIRYKSRLVPVARGSDPFMIESVRLKSQLKVSSEWKRITSVIFDEFSTTEISIDFSVKAGKDIYLIPPKIYQFIPYDYFTACMNIPDPSADKLDAAAEIFEPLFFYLYFLYRDGDHEILENDLAACGEYLECSESGVLQRPLLQKNLKDYFASYSLFRDDEMMLNGLRKIVVS